MKPIVKIGYLIDQHEDWHRKKNNLSYEDESISFKNCPGCQLCDQIEKLSIENGLKTTSKKGSATKPKAGDKMPKPEFTYDEYKKLKAEGLQNKEIAVKFDISPSTVTKRVQQWERAERRKPIKAVEKPEKILIDDTKERMNKLIQENAGLVAEVEELKEKLKYLEASASDSEKEAAAAIEYIEKESELLIETDVLKQQVQMYQDENKRLNENLSETRQELAKYKGDSILFRSVLKAVL